MQNDWSINPLDLLHQWHCYHIVRSYIIIAGGVNLLLWFSLIAVVKNYFHLYLNVYVYEEPVRSISGFEPEASSAMMWLVQVWIMYMSNLLTALSFPRTLRPKSTIRKEYPGIYASVLMNKMWDYKLGRRQVCRHALGRSCQGTFTDPNKCLSQTKKAWAIQSEHIKVTTPLT